MKRKPMNLREYWDAVGTENIEKIVNELGSSIQYFRMMRYGIKKPGGAQALRIVELARKHTAPYEPDLALLLSGVPRAGHNPARQLQPANDYLRARKRLLGKNEQQTKQQIEQTHQAAEEMSIEASG